MSVLSSRKRSCGIALLSPANSCAFLSGRDQKTGPVTKVGETEMIEARSRRNKAWWTAALLGAVLSPTWYGLLVLQPETFWQGLSLSCVQSLAGIFGILGTVRIHSD